jgi:hypothetical protein
MLFTLENSQVICASLYPQLSLSKKFLLLAIPSIEITILRTDVFNDKL